MGVAERQTHLCEMAAQWVAGQRGGNEPTLISKPDEKEREAPAVDAWFNDGVGHIYIEHTLIEPFPGQLADDIRLNDFFGEFVQRFENSLPTPRYYVIAVTAGAIDGLTNAKAQQAMDRLEEWVREMAPDLEPHGLGRKGAAVLNPPASPFGVWLFRWDNGACEEGRLFHGRATPEDVQPDRVERIGSALDAKCWKLEASRTPGSVTVLLLETADIQTTDPSSVARASYLAVRQRLEQSDERGPFPVPDIVLTVDAFDSLEVVRNADGWSGAALTPRGPFDRG